MIASLLCCLFFLLLRRLRHHDHRVLFAMTKAEVLACAFEFLPRIHSDLDNSFSERRNERGMCVIEFLKSTRLPVKRKRRHSAWFEITISLLTSERLNSLSKTTIREAMGDDRWRMGVGLDKQQYAVWNGRTSSSSSSTSPVVVVVTLGCSSFPRAIGE